MGKQRTLTMDVEVRRGEGRAGIVNSLDMALAIGGVRIMPGHYRVTIERTQPKREVSHG